MGRFGYTRKSEFQTSEVGSRKFHGNPLKLESQFGRTSSKLEHWQIGCDVIPTSDFPRFMKRGVHTHGVQFKSQVGAGNNVTCELTEVGVGEVLSTFRVEIPTLGVVPPETFDLGGGKSRLQNTTGTHHKSIRSFNGRSALKSTFLHTFRIPSFIHSTSLTKDKLVNQGR